MHVVATAGHVDHGKSTLVRALTGMEPDRWAEERRRGLTIDLGFAWTDLPSGERIAFVDVPGHERFVTNMLAGVGAVPAALFVVAANEGWKPQSQEHLDALTAFGVQDVLLVITKADLADPTAAEAAAREQLSAAGLSDVDAVAVSATTGAGLGALLESLDKLLARLPMHDIAAPVRLWVDRAFTIRGAGTVVTATLSAGAVAIGDELLLTPAMRRVVVRGLESCKQPQRAVEATARVALNLRNVEAGSVQRGMALVSPDTWTLTEEAALRIDDEKLPRRVVAHIGSAAVPARLRQLGPRAVRAGFDQPVPLREGDLLLLRAPESRSIWRAVVTDASPNVSRLATRRPPVVARRVPAVEDVLSSTAVQALLDGLAADRIGVIAVADAQALGVSAAEIAAATRAGVLLRISPALLASADGPSRAAQLLRDLPQPFTVSEAGRAFATTRRVTLPVLEHLDSRRSTRRLDGGKRTVTGPSA